MIVRVRAGTTVAELARALRRSSARWCRSTRAEPERATVGGVLSAGQSGWRRLRYGPVRDTVLEVRFVSRRGSPSQGRGAGGEERERLRPVPPARRVPRDPRRAGRGGAALPACSGAVRLVPRARRSTPSRWPGRLYRPSSVLWDGGEVWVLLEGHPEDVAAQARAVLGRVGPEPVGPPPAIGATGAACRSPPPSCAGLPPAERWWAEVGVGTVHADGPRAGRRRPREGVAAPFGARRGCPEPGGQGPLRSLRAAQPGPAGPVSVPAGPGEAGREAWPGPANAVLTGVVAGRGPLPVDADELASCVACGLCLPVLPDLSGHRRGVGLAPRAHRGHAGGAGGRPHGRASSPTSWAAACSAGRARWPVPRPCPSAGSWREPARPWPTGTGAVPWWQRAAYGVLGQHRLLLALSSAGAVAQRCASRPEAPGPPPRPAAPAAAPAAAGAQRKRRVAVHRLRHGRLAAPGAPRCPRRWSRRPGRAWPFPARERDCCGALHVHAGLAAPARRLARRVMASMPGDAPILVDSAGCGAALKDYGHLLGTAEAAEFSSRVLDVHEWLALRLDRLPGAASRQGHGSGGVGTGRRAGPVPPAPGPAGPRRRPHRAGPVRGAGRARRRRAVLRCRRRLQRPASRAGRAHPGPEAGGGRPARAATVVASANPGCSLWLAAAGVEVRHPMEIVAEAIGVAGGR